MKKLKSCLAIILVLVMCIATMPISASASDVVKSGEASAYLNNLQINGEVITDCTQEMSGTNWSVRGSTIFITGDITSTGIIIKAKSSVTAIQVIVQTDCEISGMFYGINCNTGLTLTLNGLGLGPNLNIVAGYTGIYCEGLLTFQGEGTVNISTDNPERAKAAINQAHWSSEQMTITPDVRVNINWNADSNRDVYGLSGVTTISNGMGNNQLGKMSIHVSNSGTGNAYAVDDSFNKCYADILYRPNPAQFDINIKTIDKLNLTVVAPQLGKEPTFSGTSSSDLVTISSIDWMLDNKFQMASTSKFTQGHSYTVNIYCDLPANTEFTQNAEITVNRIPATVEKISGNQRQRITLEFDKFTISHIDINVTAPTVGATPQTELPLAGDGYKITDITWDEKGSVDSLTTTFQNGKSYWVGLRIEPTTGNLLASEDALNITVNGQRASVRNYYGSVSGAYIEYTFPVIGAVGYNCYIGDTQITNLNCDDVFGDGTVTYYPKGTYDSSYDTLILNNFNMDVTSLANYYTISDGSRSAIYIGNDTKVILKGTNNINTNNKCNGITFQNWYLYFKGDGTLTVDAGNKYSAYKGTQDYMFFNDNVDVTFKGKRAIDSMQGDGTISLFDNSSVYCYSYISDAETGLCEPAINNPYIAVQNGAKLVAECEGRSQAISTWASDDLTVAEYNIRILKTNEFGTPYTPPVGLDKSGGVSQMDCRYVEISVKYNMGDIDLNGVINSSDYAMLYSNVSCQISLTNAQKATADLNHDGAIDAFDVIQLDCYLNGVCDIEGNYI